VPIHAAHERLEQLAKQAIGLVTLELSAARAEYLYV
jgi:hypothetical protein